ncbi:hypothetical protein J6590_083493 [Homalodisca vitripennis]|nr:hypothetical protein J6590_084456 [Homalodisca vitripennis]KAG8319810.1 hypothetical protein J6590_083493 [Homalodisca vitripennis]
MSILKQWVNPIPPISSSSPSPHQNMGAPHGTHRTKPTSCENLQLPRRAPRGGRRTACAGSCERALSLISLSNVVVKSTFQFTPTSAEEVINSLGASGSSG